MISVVIPTLNRFELLHAALESVASQTVGAEIEVIVVNDGGRSVVPVVRAWENRLKIKLVELDERQGPAAARNIGIELSEGKYIAFLDDDDLFLPEHLAAGCKHLDSGAADLVYLGAIVADRRLNSRPVDLAEFPRKAYPYDQRFMLVANFIHTGSVIARNFKDTPVRFDELLPVCEDWDIWIALSETLGYRIAFVDKIETIYHQVPDVVGLVASGQLTSPSQFELARDYIYAKWPSQDRIVLTYRDWLLAFERFRSELIAKNWPMPNLLFDEILNYLHRRISNGEPADYADISSFFDLGEELDHLENQIAASRAEYCEQVA